jgi:hypothetical protein
MSNGISKFLLKKREVGSLCIAPSEMNRLYCDLLLLPTNSEEG